MGRREATCSCGALRLQAEGEPVRISMCHCLACQRRTGSAFAIQARFPAERVQISGNARTYRRLSDSGEERAFSFCPECGSTVYYTSADSPDLVAVPIGAFADPSFPPPTVSVHEACMHPWVALPPGVERDHWAPVQVLYEAGRYAEAADRGQEVVAAHPGIGYLLYNVACCESLAGRPDDAIGHLRDAIATDEEIRSHAAGDSDFDSIRGDPAFRALIA
ncbi:MAG TPA: GFA family protein [Gaiellales bacterium]|nr:GFA family protein [Gaiellales bacterium]